MRSLGATLVVLLLCLSAALGAQSPASVSPYRVGWGKSIIVGGTGVATYVLGEQASARMDLLRAEDLDRLSVNDIFPPDRFAARQNSAFAKTVSDVSGYGSMLLPLTLLAGDFSRKHADDVALMYAQGFSLNYGVVNLSKNLVLRSRPFVYNPDVPLSRKQVGNARRSFYSGHTSTAAFNSFFTAQVYSDFYPDAGAKPLVWAGAITLPAITGLTRVLSGNHYWTDVLVGYAVGAGIGVLVPRLHRRGE